MERSTSPFSPPDAPTPAVEQDPGRLTVLQHMQHGMAGKDRPAMHHALAQLIKSESAVGERERILARLAVLQRMKEDIAGHDRPAMLHAVLQLAKLESGALRQLERGSGASG